MVDIQLDSKFRYSSPSPSPSRHSIQFNPGTLSTAVEFRFEEYADSDTAIQAVQDLANPPDGNFVVPPNAVSSYVLVTPVENFAAAGQMATIVIDIDDTAPSSTRIYRANPGSEWNFVSLTTEMRDGNAYAQTNQGGVFVAASGIDTLGIAVGVSVSAIVLIVVACGAAIGVYFAVRPEKWRKTKDNVRKTKTKVSRSFAKQV